MKCPGCGAPCAVVLLLSVECLNPRCRHHVEMRRKVQHLTELIGDEPAADYVEWAIRQACTTVGEPGP